MNPSYRLQELNNRLAVWAKDSRLKTAAEDVLGISPDSSELLSLLRRWRSGDASATPELIWLDAAAMGNARGACTESGLIALNSD